MNDNNIRIILGDRIPTQEEAQEYIYKTDGISDGEPHLIKPNGGTSGYNLKEAHEKNITKSKVRFDENYLAIQYLYRLGLEEYFLNTTKIRQYDAELRNNELNFVPVPKEKQDFYQKYSTWDLDFFYIRSNLPIERLGEKDLSKLQAMVDDDNFTLTDELLEIVKRTFPMVIKIDPKKSDDMPIGTFDRAGSASPNINLVINLKTSPDTNVNEEYVVYEQNIERQKYLNSSDFVDTLQENLSEELGYPVTIFIV